MLISKYSRYNLCLIIRMRGEINIHHILTAEKATEISPPKSPQNVPLTVACTPPGILGYIFQLAVEPQILPGGHINLAGVKKG